MDARLSFDFATSLPALAPLVSVPRTHADELVRNHRQLVDRVAGRVFRDISSSIAFEDLVQIGNVALIEAARTFVDLGTAHFSTYAAIRVRGAMIDELRRGATISRGAMRRRREIDQSRRELSLQLGRPPNDEEIAQRMEMPLSAYNAAVAAARSAEHLSMDEAYSDSNLCFADTSARADDVLESKDRHQALVEAISSLEERDQVILKMYFIEERSLEDIGKIYNISQSRVCQIKRIVLTKLREKMKYW